MAWDYIYVMRCTESVNTGCTQEWMEAEQAHEILSFLPTLTLDDSKIILTGFVSALVVVFGYKALAKFIKSL